MIGQNNLEIFNPIRFCILTVIVTIIFIHGGSTLVIGPDDKEIEEGCLSSSKSSESGISDPMGLLFRQLKVQIKPTSLPPEEMPIPVSGTKNNNPSLVKHNPRIKTRDLKNQAKYYPQNPDSILNANIPNGSGQESLGPSFGKKTLKSKPSEVGSLGFAGGLKFYATKRKKPKPKPKDSEEYEEEDEEEDEENNSEIVPNPGVIDQIPPSNKPPKKDPSKTNTPSGKVIFEEGFTDRNWDSKWIYPKLSENGTNSKRFEKFFRVRSKSRRSGKPVDYGVMTSNKGSEDYALATTFAPLNSNDGSLALQFSLQYQTKPYCEHVYLRLFDCRFRAEDFSPEMPFLIQFGPNFCGTEKNEISVEMLDPYKSELAVVNKEIEAVTSTDLHTYTLIIDPESNYRILRNHTSVQNGTLRDVFQNYQGFPSLCSVGLIVWHSVLDKFFKGQIIIDDILISTDIDYVDKKRVEILGLPLMTPDMGHGSNKSSV